MAYAMTATALPDARPRAKWHEGRRLARRHAQALFKAAIERGFAIVPDLKGKPG